MKRIDKRCAPITFPDPEPESTERDRTEPNDLAAAEANDSGIVTARPNAVPSPGGEGQGEGGILVPPTALTERNRTQPNDFAPNTHGVPASAAKTEVESNDSYICDARPQAVPSPGAAGECLGERQIQLGQGEGGISVLIAPTERNRTEPNDFPPGECHNSQTPATTPSACDLPKKHKPYWLNGVYYASPSFPEEVARAMFGKK
jgi:hypothetical protein